MLMAMKDDVVVATMSYVVRRRRNHRVGIDMPTIRRMITAVLQVRSFIMFMLFIWKALEKSVNNKNVDHFQPNYEH